MRAGWEGNTRLQDFVRRLESGAGLVAEALTVAGSEIVVTKSQWAALTATGSAKVLDSGGVRINDTQTTLAEHTTDDSTDTTRLTNIPTFDALLVEHLGGGRIDREFSALTARLDPRANGGNPKTVSTFVAEVFRITRKGGEEGENEDQITVELIARSAPEDAAGEVAADFVFSFATGSGRFPTVGDPPEGAFSRPQSLIRIVAFQDDGSIADNVSWLSDSAQTGPISNANSEVTHYSIIEATNQAETHRGGSVWDLGGTVANMPRFKLEMSAYATVVMTATGASAIPDIAGTGDLTIVSRGEQWGDSTLVYEIDDGGGFVTCIDGDVLGLDNRETIDGIVYGNDLSGVSTTGPWDMRVTLTPSTDNLRSPVAIDMGIERIAITSLAGAAIIRGGARQIDPLSLKANIAKAEIDIIKTGEKDFRDYGSELLSLNHIGDIELRVYVGDPSGTYLHRSEWMLHSVWDVEDYFSKDSVHTVIGISPLRRLRIPIPPFVVTSGNNGTRKSIEVSGTRKAVWDEIVDSFVGLPTRLVGPGVEDTSNSIKKLIIDGDAKDELDRVAATGGDANIESQGRIKAVKVMRDEPIDYIVARYPLGSYTPVRIGPGFSARTDEYFVRYNWEESDRRFEKERRQLNAVALLKLGGSGLDTTRRLEDETAKWIITQALADAVGGRFLKHFGNGLIEWEIIPNERNPQLEIGDVVTIETELFVARSPINDQPIRGLVSATAYVSAVGDDWAQRLVLWIPGFEFITASFGTVTTQVGPIPTIQILDHRSRTVDPGSGDQRFRRDVVFQANETCKSVEISYSFIRPHTAANQPPASTTFDIDYDIAVTGPTIVQHTLEDGAAAEFVFLIQNNAGSTIKDSSFFLTITPYSETGGAGGTGFAGQSQLVGVDTLGNSDDVGTRVQTVDGQEVAGKQIVGAHGTDFDFASDGEIRIKPEAFTAFGANDATPSVSGGKNFKTANAGATTITDFDDPVDGQDIVVMIDDANTTVDFTASGLKGNGGVDWSPSSGDQLRCSYDGTDWRCWIGES